MSWTEPVTCTRTVEYALYIYCADGSTQFTTTTATSDPVTGLPPNVYCTATVTGYSTAWSAWSGWASYALIT